MRWSRRFGLVLLVACTACSGGADNSAPAVEVRDSAGIRIVESHAPGSVAPVYAELGEADLSIGVVDGDPRGAHVRTFGGVGDGPGRCPTS